MKTKQWYQSKTVWGLVVALIGYLVGVEEVAVVGLGITGYGFRDAMK